MVDEICNRLTLRIKKEIPDVDDERAEVINYGLQLLIGEIPKTLIIIGIAWILGVLDLTILALILMLPYRTASGGVHLKTHIGCIVATSVFYIGNAVLSKYIVLEKIVQYIITGAIWLFSMIMIKLYAPADTEDLPILRKKERKIKKILSYVMLTLTLGASLIIKDHVLSNILIVGSIFQSISISRLAYILTKNKYGHEVYAKQQLENLN